MARARNLPISSAALGLSSSKSGIWRGEECHITTTHYRTLPQSSQTTSWFIHYTNRLYPSFFILSTFLVTTEQYQKMRKTCLRRATKASSIYCGSITLPYMSAISREHSSRFGEFISSAIETHRVRTSPILSGPKNYDGNYGSFRLVQVLYAVCTGWIK